MKGNNNRYDEEFKTNAIKMLVERGRSVRAVAKDLGISEPTLRRWVKAENKKLRKELEDAKDTVDILKKSVAIFIKP